jgi:hypothetical protein
LCYASNLNFVKFSILDLPALTITSGSLLLIGPLAAIYLFAFTRFVEKLTTHEGAWTAFGYVALLGLMSTAVATILFNKLVKITSPLFTSSVTYLIPIVGVMWGVLDGEQLQAGHFIGMVAIIGGVYLANRRAPLTLLFESESCHYRKVIGRIILSVIISDHGISGCTPVIGIKNIINRPALKAIDFESAECTNGLRLEEHR